MASFKFDDRGFRKAIDKVANDAVREVAKDAQRAFDRVHRSHAGRPVERVMPALHSAARSADWKFTDAELRSYAEAIAQGTRIIVKPDQLACCFGLLRPFEDSLSTCPVSSPSH